jgi:hypothetical protein
MKNKHEVKTMVTDEVIYITNETGLELAEQMNKIKRDYYTYATTIHITQEIFEGSEKSHFHAFIYHKGKREQSTL